MKLKSLLSAIFILSAGANHAQQIQDANLRAAIRAECPTCLDANHNLTPAATQLQSLRLNYAGIVDLGGIDGFSSLTSLQVMGNQIDSLPNMPVLLEELSLDDNPLRNLGNIQQLTHLRTLSANYCQLEELPPLPDSIQNLRVSFNQLNWVYSLPSQLRQLDLRENQLYALPLIPNLVSNLNLQYNLFSQLPSPLPDSLKTLEVSHNRLTSLPIDWKEGLEILFVGDNELLYIDTLPNSLRTLEASNNRLQTFPKLPVHIVSVNVRNNQLDSLADMSQFVNMRDLFCGVNFFYTLPALPVSLRTLQCDFNELTSLPALPDTLISLDCHQNNLQSLPALPSELNILICSFNDLQQLPALPANLNYLNTGNNLELDCLPLLPDNLSILMAGTTNVRCLPNIPNNSNFSNPLPVCDSLFNPNSCGLLSSITPINQLSASIYPNPNRGEFVLELPVEFFGETQLYLYDQMGQLISQQPISQPRSEISLTSLPKGLYYARLHSEKGSFTHKITVQ